MKKANIFIITTAAVTIAAVSIIVVVIGLNREAATPSASSDHIVTVVTSGGMCATGGCHGESKIYADGTYENHQDISKQDMTTIQRIAEHFEYKNYPQSESGDCGESTYDGSDTSFIFPRLAGQSERAFERCQFTVQPNSGIENQLRTLERILGAYQQN